MKKLFAVLVAIFLLAVMACSGGGGEDGSSTKQTTSDIIPKTTKILDSSSSNMLSSVSPDGTQLTFNGTNPQISSLNIGDIVVIDVSPSAPHGMLRKIAGINTSGSQIVIDTTDGTIEEAIQKGSWSITQTLDSSQEIEVANLYKGVTLNKSTSIGKFEVSINNVKLTDKVIANGSISIEPSFTFSGEVDDFKLKNLLFTNTTTQTCSISLSSNASLADFDKSIEIVKYVMPTVKILIPTPIGVPFPIFVTPVLSVNVGLSGNVSVGISTGIKQEATYTNGLSYSSNDGWSKIKNQTKSFTFDPPTVTAAATAKCYAGPTLKLLLYGSVGPYASADGYLVLDADPLDNPWWNLYGGIEASAGVELVILSHLVANYSANIFDERELIAKADGAFVPPAQSNYTISGQVGSNGVGLSGVTVTLTGASSDSTITDSSGKYSFNNVANGNYTVTLSKTDYTFCPSPKAVNVSGANKTNINFTSQAKIDTYSISGTIHEGSNSGAALSGAKVTIGGGWTTTTSSTGAFKIEGIYAGTYVLLVEKPYYVTYAIPEYYVGSNQTNLSFYLTALAPP